MNKPLDLTEEAAKRLWLELIRSAIEDGDLEFILCARCQEACRVYGWNWFEFVYELCLAAANTKVVSDKKE